MRTSYFVLTTVSSRIGASKSVPLETAFVMALTTFADAATTNEDCSKKAGANDGGREALANDSGLLSIAPELRNRIYHYVVLTDTEIKVPESRRLTRPAF